MLAAGQSVLCLIGLELGSLGRSEPGLVFTLAMGRQTGQYITELNRAELNLAPAEICAGAQITRPAAGLIRTAAMLCWAGLNEPVSLN